MGRQYSCLGRFLCQMNSSPAKKAVTPFVETTCGDSLLQKACQNRNCLLHIGLQPIETKENRVILTTHSLFGAIRNLLVHNDLSRARINVMTVCYHYDIIYLSQ